MCQQLLTVNLDEKLNSSKCNLSLEPKIMTTLKHSIITALYVSLVTKGRLESPKFTFFWKRLDIKLDKHV